MGCLKQSKQGAEMLIGYCARTLDPARRAELERHIENCAECRGIVEKQMELWETLDQWKTPEVSAGFNARLYARIAREEAEPGWKKWARRIFEPAAPIALWKPAASLAAAAAVLAIALAVDAPRHPASSPQVHADQVDIEQVAKTLDELDILAPANSM